MNIKELQDWSRGGYRFMQKNVRWLISVIVLMFGTHLQAQVYDSQDVKFTTGFRECFNREQYDRIYENYFSPQLKASFPLDKAIEFFKKLRKDSGRITMIYPRPIRSAAGSETVIWPVTFERGQSAVQLITHGYRATDIVTGPLPSEAAKAASRQP